MRLLSDICLSALIDSLTTSAAICQQVQFLPPILKSVLLERVLERGSLDVDRLVHVFSSDFFDGFECLHLNNGSLISDRFLCTIAASGCRLREFCFTEAFHGAPDGITEHGVAYVLTEQKHLERLKLICHLNFRVGVLNRLSSSRLSTVELVGDAVCRCFALNHMLEDKLDFYQRDICVLAINNPNITTLCLKDIALDIDDCYSVLVALQKTLRHLEVDVIRCYVFCGRTHCYGGRDFVPFLEMADRLCRCLSFLQCRSVCDDFQLVSPSLTSDALLKLNLEGHVFEQGPRLPCNLTVLKLSLDGHENSGYFRTLRSLPRLRKLYVKLSDNFALLTPEFQNLFIEHGERLVSVTNVNFASFPTIATLVSSYCTNLKAFSVANSQEPAANSSGHELFPLFVDPHRASKIRYLQLNLLNLTANELCFICKNCCNLKALGVRGCRAMDDSLLSILAENAGDLQFLDVSACRSVCDVSIVAVAGRCQLLEAVYLGGSSVGDQGVSALAHQCGRLKICGVSDRQISPAISDLLKHFNIIQTFSKASV